MLCLWWLLHLSTGDGECYNRVTSFLQMIGRNLRRVLYAGFIVSAYWSGTSANDQYPFPFWASVSALLHWIGFTTLQTFA